MIATPYQLLEQRFKRLSALADAEAVLHWDLAAVMPRGGAQARSEQLAELKAVRHAMLTAPQTGDLLADADAVDGLDAWQRANVREMRRRCRKTW